MQLIENSPWVDTELQNIPPATLIGSIYGIKPGKHFADFHMIFDHNEFYPGLFIGTKSNDFKELLVIQDLPAKYGENYIHTVKYLTDDYEAHLSLNSLDPDLVYQVIGSSYSYS